MRAPRPASGPSRKLGRTAATAAWLLFFGWLTTKAEAREYPARMVRVIIPVAPHTPEEFGAFVRREIARWAEVVKIAGARADWI